MARLCDNYNLSPSKLGTIFEPPPSSRRLRAISPPVGQAVGEKGDNTTLITPHSFPGQEKPICCNASTPHYRSWSETVSKPYHVDTCVFICCRADKSDKKCVFVAAGTIKHSFLSSSFPRLIFRGEKTRHKKLCDYVNSFHSQSRGERRVNLQKNSASISQC